jgi:predicted dehydrogenase
MIGDIVSANCYWNQGQLWYREPNPSWTEMEYMIRDWVNWSWLSGDHIIEQHVHNIDVINWFTGKRPVSAVSFGSRQRRPTGDQYDFFSTDFVYEGGIHVHSMCRQINGCEINVSEWIQGTKGTSNCQNTVWDKEGKQVWKYDGYKLDAEGKMTEDLAISPYDQEHIDFVTSIRNGTPLNEAEFIAYSTMAGIMGRVSAYTGKLVTWDEMMNSEMKLGPKVYEMGPVDVPKTIPVPGE